TPNSGEVCVAGELIEMKTGSKGNRLPTDQKQVDRIRTKLGLVFQSFNLWSHMTILENIMEAPVHVLGQSKDEAKANAMQLLEKVGIADKAQQYPDHLVMTYALVYLFRLWEKRLSGHLQARVVIAPRT
ncbi:MAG: hypothetical protein NZ738_02630, partial [Oceanospirillaceae bacterium]|nr:hypothetical protein [Oceanospirillaceae bacterium]